MLATRACTEVQTADIPLRHCVGVPGRGAASAPAAAPGRDGELLALGQAPLGRDPEHAAVGGAAATETRQGRIRVAEPAADRGVAGVELRPYRQARQPGPGPRARRARGPGPGCRAWRYGRSSTPATPRSAAGSATRMRPWRVSVAAAPPTAACSGSRPRGA